jgi:hypothetical protein
VECNGIIGVDDLNLTAGTAEWAVKVEGAVATNDDVLEFLIQSGRVVLPSPSSTCMETTILSSGEVGENLVKVYGWLGAEI